MEIEILYRPSYSLGMLELSPREEVRVEAGSMVSMSHGVDLETEATGGLFASLSRSLLGGESFFQNTFQAPAKGGKVTVAPALPGDMLAFELRDERIMVQSGSYVASEMGVDLDTE